MYEANIFFGDSLTEGIDYKCYKSSFADCIVHSINLGVSGTTIGEYSIYPVDGNSLLSQVPKYIDNIKYASRIFLEYGINDTSAVMCDFVTVEKVIISFVKALDAIRQLNKHADIRFLTLGNRDVINKYATLQCNYLKSDYFAHYDFSFPSTIWADIYEEITDKIFIDKIPMIESTDFFCDNISEDNLHPNAKGHTIIANNIKKYI